MTHRAARLCCLLLAGVVVFCVGSPSVHPAQTDDPSSQVDYLVFEMDKAGEIRPVFNRRVASHSPGTSLPDHVFAIAAATPFSPDKPRLTVQVESASGLTVFRQVVDLPRWTRGEFHGEPQEGGRFAIDAHRVEMEMTSFVLRIPAVQGDRLIITGPQRSTFEMDQLRTTSSLLPFSSLAQGVSVVPLQEAPGDPANRVDVLLIGDGYTAAQETLFGNHVRLFKRFFFRGTPFDEYEPFVNIHGLFVPSAQSGADHPPYNPSCGSGLDCCADTDATSDPLAGTYVDTMFDASFCNANVHRLLYVNQSAILAAASAVPDWDKIVVPVNDPTYGGAGGSIIVVSTHDDALEILRHEYGHGFADLADEYDTPFPGFPPCSDITSPACEANVTDQTSSSLIKWAPWIAPATPLPTPENSPLYADEVGLFEGARYLTTGMYRPRDEKCLMHYLYVPLCEICTQEYILRLYGGGWGTPAGGIDPIDPGRESPPPGATVNGTGGGMFSLSLLQPANSPPLEEQWFIDSVPQPAQTGQPQGVFDFTPAASGTYQIDVQVRDMTPLVQPAVSDGLLTSSRSWQVEVGAADSPGEALAVKVEPSPTTPGNLVISWSPDCSTAALDYAIYEGTLGDFTSHGMKDCSDDGTVLSEEITPAVGNTYYLVVPMTIDDEGVYGSNSAGKPRPPARFTCRAGHAIASCP
jgi:hypothetical protein